MKKFIYTLIIISIAQAVVNNGLQAQMFWNNACSFTGTSSSYIARASSSSLDITGSFTLEAWLNPADAVNPANQIILQKREGANVNGYTLYLNSGRVAIRTNSTTRLLGKTTISSNNWTHVAGAYNSGSGSFAVYVNGSLDTSVIIAGAAPSSSSDSLFIGKGFNSPFEGQMDEVRIWDRVLSATEVNRYRRTSLGTSSGVYDGLVLSMTFQDNDNNGAAFSLSDWSGNNNNGLNKGVTSVDLSNRPLQTLSINECVELDGVNDYLSGPDNTSVSPDNLLTLEAWIFPRSFAKNNLIINKGSDDGTSVDYSLSLYNGRLQAIVNNKITLLSDDEIPLNQWTHVCFVFDGISGFTSFYLNGQLADVGINDKGFITDGTDSLYIGGTIDLTGFDGFIDEVRIKIAAKSENEINSYLFKSIDESNDLAGTEAVYNLDGYLVSSVGSLNRIYFRNNAFFSHSGTTDNQPVSPLDRAEALSFQDGYYLKTSSRRIPSAGTSGAMIPDTLNVMLNETISDVNVFIAINHTVEQNLSITLFAPNGESVNIFNSNSLVANSDNIVTIFDDNADSTIVNSRYVSFATKIKPLNNLNTMFTGDNTFGKWRLVVTDGIVNDTGRLYGWGIQFNNRTSKPSLLSSNVLIEGFYNSNTNVMVRDTMRFYLRYASPPFDIADSAKSYLQNNGSALLTFSNAVTGIDYYIQPQHRNSLETWSSVPLAFDNLTSQAEYDFTNDITKAFGDNMKDVDNGPDKFAIYSGDVNQDGTIDISDAELIDNDVYVFAAGYIKTDLNGDNSADITDAAIADNNIANFISVIRP